MKEISLSDIAPGSKAVKMIAKALGTTDETLAIGLCRQLAHISSAGQPLPDDRLNFALAAVAGISPKDAAEAILATQAVAVRCALMDAVGRRTSRGDGSPGFCAANGDAAGEDIGLCRSRH